jgi:lipopolysaccharide/colanic/teichoic acid biosynthesis glycosyltransferase
VGISVAAARAFEKRPVGTAARPLSWGFIAFAERVFALMLLVALLPVLAAVAAIVAVLSGKSPLIALPRAGRRGKRIWLIKLRTMWGEEADGTGGGGLIEHIENSPVPEFKTESDPRVTSSFAAFCRRYSIDEAPQLWHIVRGEMALVGPRPLTYDELATYYGYDADEVLSVRPGLTGVWQVRGRNSLTYRQRLALDLYLVRRWSLRLYVSVLIATIPAVFSGRNAG